MRTVPPALWRHLGEQFDVAAPDLGSLRTMHQRRRTLFEHQEAACATLGFHWLSDAQRRALGGDVDRHLAQLPDAIVRRYARRLGETGSGGRPFDTHETQAQAAEEAPMKPSTSLRIPLPIMRRDTIFWQSSRS
jgi:hypothetical protein